MRLAASFGYQNMLQQNTHTCELTIFLMSNFNF